MAIYVWTVCFRPKGMGGVDGRKETLTMAFPSHLLVNCICCGQHRSVFLTHTMRYRLQSFHHISFLHINIKYQVLVSWKALNGSPTYRRIGCMQRWDCLGGWKEWHIACHAKGLFENNFIVGSFAYWPFGLREERGLTPVKAWGLASLNLSARLPLSHIWIPPIEFLK